MDFSPSGRDGRIPAPEGTLKSLVLNSIVSNHVTVSRKAAFPVHGISGMAGVGKSTALVALGHDADIREYFADGVLYMSLGANATKHHIACELNRIMRATGAKEGVLKDESTASLASAVAEAALWFQSRRILFLIDDIWPRGTRFQGSLPDMQGLLNGSPDSRIVISTRSKAIAASIGSYVDVGARAPRGTGSWNIFMSHAGLTSCFPDDVVQEVRDILDLCGGLPIALALSGQAVALKVSLGLGFQCACRTYLKEAAEELHFGASFVGTAIQTSLDTLEGKLKSNGQLYPYSVSEMYSSLCVLMKQQFAPIPVLALMWKLDISSASLVCQELASLSLATMSSRYLEDGGEEENGILLHDLHLDYCSCLAEEREGTAEWHRRLLDGHMAQKSHLKSTTAALDCDEAVNFYRLAHKSRPWWSDDVLNKEYIRKYLSRHLHRAGLCIELGETLFDLRWIYSVSRHARA